MIKVTGKDYTFFGKPISLQRQGMLLELLRLWGINIMRHSYVNVSCVRILQSSFII